MRVVVIGAGISGLAAAWTVTQQAPDVEVLVLESAAQVGGKLRVAEVAGVPTDVGAEAMLARRPEGVGLAREVGLPLISPLTTSARVFAKGTGHPMPSGTVMGIPADLNALSESGVLSGEGIAAVEAERARNPLPPLTEDLSVADLVRPRLGTEILDRLVEPLLGGVYAGRADRLSVRATVPALFDQLQRGGSLLDAAARIIAATPRSDAPVFASVPGGLGQLPRALADSGRFTVRTGVTVREIRRNTSGFALHCGPVPRPEVIEADALIVATPAAKAGTLLAEIAPTAASELRQIQTASMAIITLAYQDASLPAGSGLLVATGEGLTVKGVTISSQKWPGAPDGLTLLRASIGRVGEARDLQRDDDELIALARRDLRALLDLSGQPIDALVTRWGGGLPQYEVGHVDRVARIQAAVADVPGLTICGASYDGVGIPACIATARAAAGRVLTAFVPRGQ